MYSLGIFGTDSLKRKGNEKESLSSSNYFFDIQIRSFAQIIVAIEALKTGGVLTVDLYCLVF